MKLFVLFSFLFFFLLFFDICKNNIIGLEELKFVTWGF